MIDGVVLGLITAIYCKRPNVRSSLSYRRPKQLGNKLLKSYCRSCIELKNDIPSSISGLRKSQCDERPAITLAILIMIVTHLLRSQPATVKLKR